MRKQFIRVYAGIALALLLTGLSSILALRHMREAGFERSIGEITRPLLAEIRRKLGEIADNPEEIARAVEMLNKTYPYTIRVEPISGLDLSEEDRGRLRAGEVIIARKDWMHLVYGTINSSQAIVLDPFPRMPPEVSHPGMFSGLPPAGPPPERGTPRPPDRPPPPPVYREYMQLGVLLIVLLLIGIVIYLLIRPLERRIFRLSAAAEQFGKGNLDSRAEVGGSDSIGEMARTFNAMADRIERLVDGQKELLRAVSHELRTPLARLFFLVDDAQAVDTPEKKDRQLKRIERTLTEINDLVLELLTFVRLDGEAVQLPFEKIDVSAVLRDIAEQALPLRNDVVLEIACGQMEMSAVPRYFKRAALNLVANAVEYARARVRITCGCEDGAFYLSVDDDGPGVPPEARERIFEPFFRLNEDRDGGRGGAGLGLAIVKRILTLHGGSVGVTDGPLGGARFTMTFPCRPAPSQNDTRITH